MLPHDLPTPPKAAPHARRVKLVRFPCRRVLELLTSVRFDAAFVSLPRPLGLPDGYRVLYCTHDMMDDCYIFFVEHPSFPEVDDCCTPPEIRVDWEVVQFARQSETLPYGTPLPEIEPFTPPFQTTTIAWPVPEGPTCKTQ